MAFGEGALVSSDFPCFAVALFHPSTMKITVEISDKDLPDILRFSGEKKKGPAIAKLLADSLMLKRRRDLSERVMSGEWQVAVEAWPASRARERASDPWKR
jgi:hypothetical protein